MFVLNAFNGGVTVRQIGHGGGVDGEGNPIKGHLTYDVWPLHVDGDTYQGVKSRSTLHVALLEPNDPVTRKPHGTVPIGLWVPGGYRPYGGDQDVADGKEFGIRWLEDPWTRVTAPGLCSIVSYADVALRVWWVSEPGLESP